MSAADPDSSPEEKTRSSFLFSFRKRKSKRKHAETTPNNELDSEHDTSSVARQSTSVSKVMKNEFKEPKSRLRKIKLSLIGIPKPNLKSIKLPKRETNPSQARKTIGKGGFFMLSSPKQKRSDTKIRTHNSLERFAFEFLGKRLPPIAGYRESYEQAAIPLIYESYMSTAILTSLIITIPTFVFSLLLELTFFHLSAAFSFTGSIVLTGIVFAMSLMLWLIYPLSRRRTFKSKLENQLAYSFGILGVLAASGMTIERLFEKLGPSESNPVLSSLARRLVRNIRAFGLDTESALREVANHTPSPTFAKMLEGMAIAFKTTGSVTELVLYESERLFQERRERLKKVIDNLGVMAELYITVVVVGPIIFIVMMTIFGLLPSAGLPSPIFLINVIVFLGVPVIGVVFIIILDSMVTNA